MLQNNRSPLRSLGFAGLFLFFAGPTPVHAASVDFYGLGTLPSATSSSGYGVNNAGQVVGYCTLGSGAPGAFLYTPAPGGGTMADLGTLGGVGSYAYGIDDAG